MEPTLNPTDPADDPIEALLRSAPRSIPDDGFTARVCAALPPREAGVSPARRLVLAGALILGSLLAWLAWPRLDPELSAALADVTRRWSFEPWHALLLVVALSAWVIGRDAREGGVSAD